MNFKYLVENILICGDIHIHLFDGDSLEFNTFEVHTRDLDCPLVKDLNDYVVTGIESGNDGFLHMYVRLC